MLDRAENYISLTEGRSGFRPFLFADLQYSYTYAIIKGIQGEGFDSLPTVYAQGDDTPTQSAGGLGRGQRTGLALNFFAG